MAAVRRNIVQNGAARTAYVNGVKLLKNEFLGPTTSDAGIPGTRRRLSTYDLFVVWHHRAMMLLTPPTQDIRNAAHSGPVFLPWHRFMLILLERHLQRVLENPDFGLPYWDWAADGERTPSAQRSAPIWSTTRMGGNGNPVATGPFRSGEWQIRLDSTASGDLVQTNRGLARAFSTSITLPNRAEVRATLNQSTYDAPPWTDSPSSFRNFVEGWRPSPGPRMHNRVHVWVGGDMVRATSPNDPVFFLNHCNVDRIWAMWQADRSGSPAQSYLPSQNADSSLRGHRLDDEMHALISEPATPRAMLDPSALYSYDTLAVA
jgi:tyrosinase